MSPKDELSNVKQRIIAAAIQLFAENGYYKTTTTNIASAVGISQPYLFHFFKKKEELYLAVLEQAKQQVIQAFSNAEASPDKLKEAMSDAFNHLLKQNRNEILLTMTAHAIPEPDIREAVRQGFDEIYETLKQKFNEAGFSDPGQEAINFIGEGLLVALSENVDLPKLRPRHR